MRTPRSPLTAQSLSGQVLVSTLTPFNDAGALLRESTTDQARRLARVDGVNGIAVNTSARERAVMTVEEQVEVIRCTRLGLNADQILVSCVGELSESVFEVVGACKRAGADAVIVFPTSRSIAFSAHSLQERLVQFAKITSQLALPVIVALGNELTRWAKAPEDIAQLAKVGQNIVGFDMGDDDNVLRYDQNYYALKAIDRPLALFSSSSGALFHNLNTGSDGVLSSLAYVAPHEIAVLYYASRSGQFHQAQAVHNRLSPLVKLLNGRNADNREMIYRAAAHTRGLLASKVARGESGPLSPDLAADLQSTLDDIALKPISWV